MKLRNKKTGEIIEFDAILPVKDVSGDSVAHLEYNSLSELNEEWEDAPEEYWYIDYDGGILCGESDNSSSEKMMISMGNHFESLEKADKAVEKLKAWKRLKDKGFKFNSCKIEMSEIVVPEITITAFIDTEEPETLNLVNLLFGGKK